VRVLVEVQRENERSDQLSLELAWMLRLNPAHAVAVETEQSVNYYHLVACTWRGSTRAAVGFGERRRPAAGPRHGQIPGPTNSKALAGRPVTLRRENPYVLTGIAGQFP